MRFCPKPLFLNCKLYAILAVSLAPAILTLGSSAYAQEEALSLEEAMKFCSQLDNSSDRLDCFEALAASVDTPTELPQPAASTPETPDKPTESSKNVAEASRAPAETEQNREKRRRGIRLPFFGGKDKDKSDFDVARQPSTEEDNNEAESKFIIQRSDAPELKRKRRESYEATVYRAWRNAAGELRVAFTHGEIWVQLDQSLDHEPNPGDTVEFRPMSFGSWLVYFNSAERGIPMRIARRSK
ncbi:MAG: hypothetical protein AAGD92_02825 [Pseudomonadota bacterium]